LQSRSILAERMTRHQRRRKSLRGTRSQSREDGVQQLCLPNGLRQIGRDSDLAAARAIAPLSRGTQHHYCSCAPVRASLDGFGQREAVHFRHLRIKKDERKTSPEALTFS